MIWININFSLLVFVVVYLYFIVLAKSVYLKKIWIETTWGKIALFFGIGHLIIVSIWGFIILAALQHDALAGLGWAYFIFADFPVSVLTWIIDAVCSALITNSKLFFWINNLIMPYLLFSILGGLQYFFWGFLIGKLFEKMSRKNSGK
jgi:hypothetical protein